jgi:hypothetical protein
VEQVHDNLRKMEQDADETRAQLVLSLSAAESKYEQLLRNSRDEKARLVEEKIRSVAMEKTKRERAEHAEQEWRL